MPICPSNYGTMKIPQCHCAQCTRRPQGFLHELQNALPPLLHGRSNYGRLWSFEPQGLPQRRKNIMSTIHILCIGCEVNHISFFQAILLNSDSSQCATRFNWSTRLQQHQWIVSPLVHHINPWPASDTLQRKRTAQVNHSMYLDVSIISTDILWIMAAD